MSKTTESKERVFVNDKTYFINGEFNNEMRSAVVWQLEKHINELKDRKDATLTFYISSNGGDGYLVMDMIDLFKRAKRLGIVVRTIVTSHAYSAGSMLAITGTKGERYISKNAEHLPHYGSFSAGWNSTPLQLDRSGKHLKRWTETMIAHYKEHADIPNIEEHLKDDLFFIPSSKCIKWKLADKYTDDL